MITLAMKVKVLSMRFLLVAAIFASLGITFTLIRNNKLEVNYVSVDGNLIQQQRAEIYERLSDLDLSNMTIDELKYGFEEVSWISQVSVERKWPDSLIVNVRPERAIALWNDDAFINPQGQAFTSEYELASVDKDHRLAQLYGPEGSEKEVVLQYQQLNNALFKIGQSIDEIRLNERGAWTFRNNTGVEVLLGKDELMDRIQRLLLVVEHVELMGKLDSVRVIDTRYSNGVSISWKATTDGLEIAKTFNLQREQKL